MADAPKVVNILYEVKVMTEMSNKPIALNGWLFCIHAEFLLTEEKNISLGNQLLAGAGMHRVSQLSHIEDRWW